MVGGGVRLSQMDKEIISFIEATKIPVVTTWGAADIFPHGFSLHMGNIGKSGNQSAVDLVQECDLLLCLGTRFTPKNIINENWIMTQEILQIKNIEIIDSIKKYRFSKNHFFFYSILNY